MKTPSAILSNLTLLVVTLVWGATFTLTKDALSTVSVFSFLTMRFIMASVGLVAICMLSKTRRKALRSPRMWLIGGILGFFLFATYAFQTIGLKTTSASTAGFLTGLSVVIVPIIAIPLLRSRASSRVWLAATISIIGLALLVGTDFLHVAVGDVDVILCAIFVALQMVYIEKYGGPLDAMVLATVEVVILSVCCMVVLTLQQQWLQFTSPVWQAPTVWWATLICALPGTVFAYWAQNAFQKSSTSAQTAIIFSMEPVFAAAISYLSLASWPSWPSLIGGILIILSMLIAEPSVRWRYFRKRRIIQ